jgi:hypothetical protein
VLWDVWTVAKNDMTTPATLIAGPFDFFTPLTNTTNYGICYTFNQSAPNPVSGMYIKQRREEGEKRRGEEGKREGDTEIIKPRTH